MPDQEDFRTIVPDQPPPNDDCPTAEVLFGRTFVWVVTQSAMQPLAFDPRILVGIQSRQEEGSSRQQGAVVLASGAGPQIVPTVHDLGELLEVLRRLSYELARVRQEGESDEPSA